ncbi:MAG TPA: LysR family transcriptional regulator [Stellaceae bacterium]|jgi:DNA-binding transcriptional LysR family regulator|nr:LysR family transcriptional regulator [Stellaceae bacterium]
MNINNLDLNLLKAFDAVMHEGNLTTAGARLGLTQPAMSRAIQRLRSVYDDPLFVRSAHGMLPTEYAKELAAPVQNALRTLQSAVELAGNFVPAKSTRLFRIVMTDVASVFYLPDLLPRLQKVAPHLRIEAIQMPRDQYAEALESGAVELAIGQLPKKQNLYQQRLRSLEFVCVMRKNHPAVGRIISMAEFMDARHITITAPARMDEMVRHALGRRAVHRKVALAAPFYLTVPAVLSKTDLIAAMPDSVMTFAKAWNLKKVPLPFRVPSVSMGQFWHERSHHDAGHRWLRNIIAELAGK